MNLSDISIKHINSSLVTSTNESADEYGDSYGEINSEIRAVYEIEGVRVAFFYGKQAPFYTENNLSKCLEYIDEDKEPVIYNLFYIHQLDDDIFAYVKADIEDRDVKKAGMNPSHKQSLS